VRLFLIGMLVISSQLALANDSVKVEKVNTKKKLVIINAGKKAGFKKKKKVCFYDMQNEKVGCGTVRSAKADGASIFIKKDETLAKIEVGMVAAVEKKDKDVKISIDEPTGEAEEESKPAHNYVSIFGAFPLIDSVGYKNLVYETPLNEDADSMWSSDSTVASVSLGAELGFGVKSFTLALGARQRTYTPKRVSSDYADLNDDNYFEEYAESIGKGTSTGFWFDFYWLRMDYGLASVMMGNGIDIDNSSVTFTMDKLTEVDDSVNGYVKATSTLKVVSLRTNILLDFNFGAVGFKMGTILYIPLQQQQSFSAEITDPEASEHLKNIEPDEDLKAALSHKAKFGAELLIMGYFAY
jgi:hypothetical protein